MSSQCWAFHAYHGRCALDADHDGLHEVAARWDDDECWNPEITVMTRTGGQDVPVIKVSSTPMQTTGRCYACGCDEDAHANGGCAKHQCKTYIP